MPLQLVDQASVNSALFPSAPLLPFGQLSTGFIETRRSELEAYFRAIAPRVLGCPVAESFLGIGDSSIPFKVRGWLLIQAQKSDNAN